MLFPLMIQSDNRLGVQPECSMIICSKSIAGTWEKVSPAVEVSVAGVSSLGITSNGILLKTARGGQVNSSIFNHLIHI